MCGICGFVTTRDVPDAAIILERMVASLRHRGPDACGMWETGKRGSGEAGKRGNGETERWGNGETGKRGNGETGAECTDLPMHRFAASHAYLGHTRLAIIDLSEAGKQPMPNEDGTVWVTYNGEVYNFHKLRQQLERKGHSFRSRTDTEVLIHAYEEWGEEFVCKLQGMFAFAIWDGRQRARGGKLMLARDRLGIKPIYYAHLLDGTLVFASELRAVLKHPAVSREIDPLAVDAYFAYGYIPAPLTIYKAVRKLPPAHYLVWHNGEIKLHRYWQLDFTRKRTESPEELAEELRERLKEAVKLHLISDVPLGAFLSGGMDSSSIVALMAQVSDQPIKTFSIGFDDDRYNELPYARLIAKRYATEHHEFKVEAPTASLMPDLIGYFGEPFADSSALPTFIISKIARNHVTVVLSGDGGDEIFAGYEWTRRALLLGRRGNWAIGKLDNWETGKAGNWAGDWQEAMIRHGKGLWYQALKLWRDWQSDPVAVFQRRTRTNFAIRSLLYGADLLAALSGQCADEIQNEFLAQAPVSDWRESLLYCDTMLYLPDDCLTKVDRMSMAVALEVRPPLLDHTIVEFAASLPFDLKWRNGTTKWLLKQAMKNDLPEETMKQRKQGFSVPVAKWMQGKLGDELLARFSKSVPLLNSETVRKMVQLHKSNKANFGHLLWRLYVWSVWAESCR